MQIVLSSGSPFRPKGLARSLHLLRPPGVWFLNRGPRFSSSPLAQHPLVPFAFLLFNFSFFALRCLSFRSPLCAPLLCSVPPAPLLLPLPLCCPLISSSYFHLPPVPPPAGAHQQLTCSKLSMMFFIETFKSLHFFTCRSVCIYITPKQSSSSISLYYGFFLKLWFFEIWWLTSMSLRLRDMGFKPDSSFSVSAEASVLVIWVHYKGFDFFGFLCL